MRKLALLPGALLLAALASPATASTLMHWSEPADQHSLSFQSSITGFDATGFWTLLAGLDYGDIPEMVVTAPRLEQSWEDITWTLFRLDPILGQESPPFFGTQDSEVPVPAQPAEPVPSQELAQCLLAVDSQLANCLRNARINNTGCLATAGLVAYLPGRLIAVAVCTGLYEWEHYRCNETSRRGRERCHTAWS